MKTKPVKPTRAQLERQILELNSQLVHGYYFASAALHKAGSDKPKGSGVVLQLSFFGGESVFAPVCIKDGLSPETILAIQRDLRRSYDQSVEFVPKAV